jgi:hypothetical protein
LPDKFLNYYFKFLPGEALSSDLYLKSCHCSSVWGVLFFIVSSHSGIYISFFPPESIWTITWINFINSYFSYSSWNITLHTGEASAVCGCVVLCVCVCVYVCMLRYFRRLQDKDPDVRLLNVQVNFICNLICEIAVSLVKDLNKWFSFS